MMKRLAKLSVSAAVVGSGIFAIATPAHAAVPSCVTVRQTSSTSITVNNGCDYSVRLMVVYTSAPAGACFTLAAHSSKSVSSRYSFHHLQSC